MGDGKKTETRMYQGESGGIRGNKRMIKGEWQRVGGEQLCWCLESMSRNKQSALNHGWRGKGLGHSFGGKNTESRSRAASRVAQVQAVRKDSNGSRPGTPG